MYKLIISFFLFLQITALNAQNADSTDLVLQVKKAENDSTKILALGNLARFYAPFDNKNAEKNYLKALALCNLIVEQGEGDFFEQEKASLQSSLGVTYYMTANYSKALEAEMAAIQGFEKYGIKEKLGRCYVVIGAIYKQQNQPKKALQFHEKALNHTKKIMTR